MQSKRMRNCSHCKRLPSHHIIIFCTIHDSTFPTTNKQLNNLTSIIDYADADFPVERGQITGGDSPYEAYLISPKQTPASAFLASPATLLFKLDTSSPTYKVYKVTQSYSVTVLVLKTLACRVVLPEGGSGQWVISIVLGMAAKTVGSVREDTVT